MPDSGDDRAPLLELRGHPRLEGPEGPGALRLGAGGLAFLGGESGSGKTRLLRQLVDLEAAREGEVFVLGRPQASLDVARLRRHVALLPQELPLHPGTGRDLLDQVRGFARNRGRCLEPADLEGWLERLELGPHLDTPIDRLSGGEKRRLGLAALLVPRPDVLLLDEPEAGLDGRRRETLERYVERTLGDSRAVLWISHLDPPERFGDAPRYRLTTEARAS